MDNERMITVDPNGTPYLSHAWNVKSTFRPKYYKKIKTSNGKHRYFYSEKEYQAYLDGQQSTRSSPQSTTSTRKHPISITSDDPNLESTNGWFAEQIADIKRRRKKNIGKQQQQKRAEAIRAGQKQAHMRYAEREKAKKQKKESYLQEQEQAKKERKEHIDKQQQKRAEAIRAGQKQARMRYAEEEKAKKQKKESYLEAWKAKAAEVEKAEADAAVIEKKRREQQDKRQLPESVSLKDFIFGGQFRKDLKTSKRDLKKVQKELKRQTSKLSKLDEQIEELSAKKQTARNKKKLEQLQAQRAELQSSMIESRRQRLQAIQDYSAAMYRYERTTLVGKVKRKVRNGNKTAQKYIEKYSNMLLSKLPKIKTK